MNEKLAFLFLAIQGVACSSLFYYPDQNFHYDPRELKLSPEAVFFKADDQTKLSAWLFKASVPFRGTIVQFHGNGENMSSHYLSLAWLPAQGYQLFTFDYRGYGQSEGKPNHEGTLKDGIAALKEAWLRHLQAIKSLNPDLDEVALHKKNQQYPFVIYGQSLGGAIAMRSMLDAGFKDRTQLLVMDSSLISYKEIARRKLASFWLTWPFSWLPMIFVSDEYAPKEQIATLETPLLVIHDRHDPVVPFECGQRIFDEAQMPKKDFWILESDPKEAGHVSVFAKNPYRKRFLEKIAH